MGTWVIMSTGSLEGFGGPFGGGSTLLSPDLTSFLGVEHGHFFGGEPKNMGG